MARGRVAGVVLGRVGVLEGSGGWPQLITNRVLSGLRCQPFNLPQVRGGRGVALTGNVLYEASGGTVYRVATDAEAEGDANQSAA